MASPRVFISSTCYDLQEIRNQLRKFIDDFGFEPVMSEFGDIFYDYKKHIQDSCLLEIEKCQLFILIIGNHYGSYYYDKNELHEVPDSVTLQEFRKAIDTKVFKHIFIQKFVEYDYKNYIKAKENNLKRHLENRTFKDEDEQEKEIRKLTTVFNTTYSFSQDSYKYIFPFLDIIFSQKSNNAIIVFENFDNIKEALRKQWAGFMYESITKKESIPYRIVETIAEKIDKIERQLKLLVEGQVSQDKEENKITFDISKMAADINISSFEQFKNELYTVLDDIFETEVNFSQEPRIILKSKISKTTAQQWLESLKDLVREYQWAKSIEIITLMGNCGISYSYYKYRDGIDYQSIFKLYSIYNKVLKEFPSDSIDAFYNLVISRFNMYYKPEEENTVPVSENDNDDLPF